MPQKTSVATSATLPVESSAAASVDPTSLERQQFISESLSAERLAVAAHRYLRRTTEAELRTMAAEGEITDSDLAVLLEAKRLNERGMMRN